MRRNSPLVASIKFLSKFLSTAVIFYAPNAQADTRCLVDVRSLIGSNPADENFAKELKTGEFIADLKEQLDSLPFAKFSTLSHEQQKVPLQEKAVFRVQNAAKKTNTVFVEVECVSDSGARLQVDWNSEDGASILSTQLRLMNGKNWVLGTDHEDKSSTIVSIKVECTEHK